MNDYETRWTRKDRFLINLIKMIEIEEDKKTREEYQKIIDRIIEDNKKHIYYHQRMNDDVD